MFKAKVEVESITSTKYSDQIIMRPVTNGTPEDNTYCKATPAGQIDLTITNENLIGKIKAGDKYYVTFSKE